MRQLVAALVAAAIAMPALAQDWREKAVPMVKGEKKVVDATFPQPGSLWVSVRDDGSKRDGFASYLCLVLADAGMGAKDFVVIKVWDAASMARGEMKELGRNECSRG